ncbi:MAG: hypothetical protein VKO39_06570 [Cyanobacteriota bacterium]|nr:hypothetical protein [Cyanobacteriota bacterium]
MAWEIVLLAILFRCTHALTPPGIVVDGPRYRPLAFRRLKAEDSGLSSIQHPGVGDRPWKPGET